MLVASTLLLPSALNLANYVWTDRMFGRLRDRVTPSGITRALCCIRNGLLSVTMETPRGRHSWFTRAAGWLRRCHLYDPMLDRQAGSCVAQDDPGVWRRRLYDGDELPPAAK